ncbi:zinc finger CCCH domain-containing protein 14 [Toxorhynchites rutilus septentrionalis]|uniref:zinc finger CCCH domain-containing protein 14 n=1 Tax=Toxorhynchites rutilus septentrionalis TaxID=329112 RepID=UPI00247A4E17|nr:zinc finger CCCH domain-containing protein 14 [Toxorhynchites rutilus septentrionalis]
MDSLGSEIGQKMRSAVKAKLIELGTGSASGYIDDELPDYVMIMVANKRSRQQMIDDLTLFLGSQTEVFVSWLHQVLQKLEEVTLPATAVAPTTAGKISKESSGKRKGGEQKERKDKKKDKKTKKKEKSPDPKETAIEEQHTPPHPSQLGVGSIQDVFANQFIQQAKRTLDIEVSVPKKDTRDRTPPLQDNSHPRMGNDFDIPTISEIAGHSALQKHQKELSELEEIQQRIKQAKKQLRSMRSDESEDEDFLNIKANDDDLENIEDGVVGESRRKDKRKASIASEKDREPVVEERSNTPPPPVVPTQKKRSIMERLGTRPEPKPATDVEPAATESSANKSNIISLSAHRREERELYVPVFRRKEMEEQAKAREARSRTNRSRSRGRERRRSPSLRSLRRESSRDRSRSRRDRERDRDRTRSPERGRKRDRDRSSGNVSNGTEVRTRIGSRVIVLPPKPEYNEEDELELPVASVVKVQPRPQIPKNKQPSKNLLLKAMAEAQRSTAANLKKTISNREESAPRHRRMLIEIPGTKSEGVPPVDVCYEFDEDDDDEDIVNHVLREEDDDDELQQILEENDEYIPEPVAVSISGRSDTDSDTGYVYVPSTKHADQQSIVVAAATAADDEATDECDPKNDAEENPKFVVTLDGAYKKTTSRSSPSHTPPPPSKSKPSIKDRIGVKVASSDNSTTPLKNRTDDEDRFHQETLKRRKERFSVKAAVPVVKDIKREASRSPDRRPKSTKKSPSPRKRDKRSSNSARKSSPSDLNELLLQRTKELLVDDSVSSSPIYMSKTDYEKIDLNSSSRKRKRVSPIQFALTDDEADDTDGEYNHHRDRERDRRERKSVERTDSIDEESVDGRKDQRRERENERRPTTDDRRKNSNGSGGSVSGEVKSPTKKIKKLESSRKFDDVPQLLSSVSVSSDGLSKSKAIIKERCKYFPGCRQGDSCEFLHPSTPCKAFPACKFGDKCLYLHPTCKFDKICNRLDCNYMHSKPSSSHGISSAGPSAPPLASSVVPVQNYKTITAKPLPALCKFYPGCTNGMCPYYHPKMCRFGKHCMNKVECNFYHHDLPGSDYHEVPSKDKFKWISPFSA